MIIKQSEINLVFITTAPRVLPSIPVSVLVSGDSGVSEEHA